jgi:hypothetical protein
MICENSEREQIHLVETLWELECRHLLGSLPEPEYRRALAALLGARRAERPMETELAVEVEYE